MGNKNKSPDESSHSRLYPDAFTLGDPLARLLVWRWKLSPVRTGVLFTLFAFGSSAILAMINGRFLPVADLAPGTNKAPFLSDWSYLITELIANPFVWGYYVWSCLAPMAVIQLLEAGGVITLTEEKIAAARQVLDQKIWPWISLAFAALVGYAYLTGYIYWLEIPLTLKLRVLLVVLPGAYAVGMAVFRIAAATRVFNRVMSEMALHPLHPDKVGGLQPLGDFAFKISWGIIIAGVMGALLEVSDLLRGVAGESAFVHGTFLLYLLVAPFVFFYPLSIAHLSMKNAKSQFLLTISQEFNQHIAHVHNEIKTISLVSGKDYDISANLARIEQLQKLHNIGDSFPVWPFDFANIRRFVVSMFTPILTFLLPFVGKLILLGFGSLLSPGTQEMLKKLLEL